MSDSLIEINDINCKEKINYFENTNNNFINNINYKSEFSKINDQNHSFRNIVNNMNNKCNIDIMDTDKFDALNEDLKIAMNKDLMYSNEQFITQEIYNTLFG